MKKHNIHRILAAVCAFAMLFSLCACGSSNTQVSEPTTPPAEESVYRQVKDVEVSWDISENVDENFPFEQYVADEREKWYLGYDAELTMYNQFPWKVCNDSFKTYSALNTVYEITGVDVTCDVALGDAAEDIHLMMATGEWPDLIVLDPNHYLVNELINGGYVYSLTELAEQYDPDFLNDIPDAMIVAGQMGTDDSVWGMISDLIPEWQYEGGTAQVNLGNQGYMVRHDIWEALGKPSIETPEDLYNTLKLFKETYPTLDGKTSIGLGGYGNGGDGTLLTIGYSFGLKQNISVNYDDNSVTTRFLDPNYEEFAVFLNKLYTEGLMDPEFFVKNEQQCKESASSNVFMMPWVTHALNDPNTVLKENDPESIFVAIEPMSATGNDFTFRGSSRATGSSIILVTKECSDPAAALRLMRYGASSNGSMQTRYGNPGQHYIVTDGEFYQTEEVIEASRSGNWSEWNKDHGIGDYYLFWYAPLPAGDQSEWNDKEFNAPNTYPYSYDSTNETFKMNTDGASDAGIAFAYIMQIGSTETARAVTCGSEAECRAIIQAMQEEIRNTPNLDKLEEFWTTQYRSNIDRFGEAAWGDPNPN